MDGGNLLRKQLLLHRRVGNDRRIILVLSNHRLAFRRENADNSKRQIPDTDHLADRIDAGKKPISYRLTEDDHSVRRTHVEICKKFATLDIPVSNQRKLFVCSLNLRKPILIAEYELAGGADDRRCCRNRRDFPYHCLNVFFRERTCRSGAQTRSSEENVPGHDHHHVAAHSVDLILNHGLGSLPDRHHCDDGADTNDYAQHGQCCSQFVAVESTHSNPEDCCQIHLHSLVPASLLPAGPQPPPPSRASREGPTKPLPPFFFFWPENPRRFRRYGIGLSRLAQGQ